MSCFAVVSKTWFKTSCLERPKSAKNGNKWQDYKYETKTNGVDRRPRFVVDERNDD
jgi:hypothetical protein